MKDQIKSGFDAQSKKAPTDLWSSISSAVDLEDVESTIKESFNQNQKVAPEASWDAIRRGVIIDEVWDRIQLKERRRKAAFFWWTTSGIAVLVFGILTGVYNYNDDYETTSLDENISKTIQIEEDSDNPSDSETITPNNSESEILSDVSTKSTTTINQDEVFKDDEVTDHVSTVSGSVENSANSIVAGVSDESDYDVATSTNTETFDRIEMENIELLGSIELLNTPVVHKIPINKVNSDYSLHIIEPQKPAPHPKFEIGLMAGINNTWIMNNDVKFGFRSGSLIRNKFSLGYNTGVTAQFNFNVRNSIGISYDFLSMMTQRYDMFANGQLHSFNMEMKQQKVGVTYKHNFIRKPHQKNYFTLRSGLFVSYSNQTNFSNTLDVGDQDLEKYDFGFKFSAGYEHCFNKLSFEYGLQSDAGILNITSETGNVLKKFEYTNTYLLGVYASLRYRF